jgi:hypothetical protein
MYNVCLQLKVSPLEMTNPEKRIEINSSYMTIRSLCLLSKLIITKNNEIHQKNDTIPDLSGTPFTWGNFDLYATSKIW